MGKLGKITLGAGALVGLGLLLSSTASAAEPPEPREPIAEPLDQRTQEQMRTALCWAIDRTLPGGTFDPTDVASLSAVFRAASNELWGADVRGNVEGDDASVARRARELQAELDRLLADSIEGREICPTQQQPAESRPATFADEPQGGTVSSVEPSGGTFASVEPPSGPSEPFASVEPPTIDPVEVTPNMVQLTAAYPEGGRFYQVKRGDVLLGTNAQRAIVYRWIASDAFKAAKAAGQSDDEARATARRLARRADIRMGAYNILGCSPFNDANYSTYKVTTKSLPAFSTGRAMTLLPHHAPNRSRLERGESALRMVELGGPGDVGKRVAAAMYDGPTTYELFWLPPLAPQKLLQGVVEVDATPWPNPGKMRRSRMHPPPNVQAIGQLLDEDLARRAWGCVPHQTVYGAA